MENSVRSSGIDVIGDVPWGTHFGLFYRAKQDLIDILVPYFQAGLENNEFCMWVTAEPLSVEDARKCMARAMHDFNTYLENGQIEIIPFSEWYRVDGVFDGDRVRDGWVDKLRKARERGFSGLRLTGNESWLGPGEWDAFIDYEQTINNVIGQYSMIGLCAYPRELCDADEVLDVVDTHQFVLSKRNGEWKLIEDKGQKNARKALRSSERFLNNVLDSFQDGISVLDRDMNVIRVNHVMEKWYSHAMPILGKKCYSAYHGRSQPCEVCPSRRAIEQGSTQSDVVPFEDETGKIKGWHELFAFPLKDDLGGIVGVIEHVRDATERKRAEEELRASERKFRAIFDQTLQFVGLLATDGTLLEANKTALEFIGATELDVVGKPFWDTPWWTHSPEMQVKLRDLVEKAARGEVVRFEATHPASDGCLHYFDFSIKPVADERDNVVLLIPEGRDITGRKRAEEELRSSQSMLKSVMGNVPVGIFWKDRSSTYLGGNDVMAKVVGLGSAEEIVGKTDYDLPWLPEQTAWFREYDRRIMDNDSPEYHIVEQMRDADGKLSWVETNKVPLHDAQGNVTGVLGTYEDITERKRAEEELRRARDELEQRVRERTSELEKSNVELEAQVRERQRSETALIASEEELLWANRALKAQSKCKEAMIRAEDEAVLLDDICHIIVDVGGYRLAWIGYVEDDELRTVRPVARAGYDEGYVDNLKIALNHPVYGSGPTGMSLKSGKPSGSRNVQADGVMQPWRNEALKRGYHSTLNLPLMYEEQILGTLVIYSGRPGAFEDEELGLLIDLADNIAFGIRAIRNRAWRDQAERELLRAKEELEVRVEERTEELRSAKEQAELYVDLMGHDINNLNHSAMGYLELALQELESEKKLRLDNKVLIERPMKSLANSSALIDNVRKLKKLMTEGVTTKPTDLNKIFRELESTSFHLDERDILINIQHVPGVMVSANELLKDAFVNLITNAIKHSDEEKPLTINVKVEPANQNGQKYYRCIVEDNGKGIPDEMKSKLFHRFQRGVTKAQGKGLGLYLVRTIVGGYNGKVWVEDRVPGDHTKGAMFVVMLPAV